MNARGMSRWALALLVGTAVVGVCAGPGSAQATRPTDTELIYRQKFTQKQFKELTRRMQEVADLLEKTEPASARAIRQALDQANRAFIDDDMNKVVEYLTQGLGAMAAMKEAGVLEELRKILKTLESGPADADEELRKIREWGKFLEDVTKLLRQQEQHEQDTRLAAEGKRLSEEMRKLGEKLQDLIRRQEQLKKDTEALPDASDAAKKLAAARREIRQLITDQEGLNDKTAKASPGQLLLASESQKGLQGRTGKAAENLDGLSKDPAVTEVRWLSLRKRN